MSTNFSKEEIEEFINEASDLLDEAEKNLLAVEQGIDFSKAYNSIFRVFHSVKGGAGMVGMNELQAHMHQVENHLQTLKTAKGISKDVATYFLEGVDAAKKLLAGERVTFAYSLPTNQDAAKAAPISPPAEKKTAVKKQDADAILPLKIMLVDDVPEVLEVLKEILENAGFQVTAYEKPEIAVEKLKEDRPDAVLSDMQMPNLTGFDVAALVAKYDPELPVVFISGLLTKQMVIDALSRGIFGVVEKPFSTGHVIEVATNATHKYRLARLLNQTISFIYYQFSDLDNFLLEKGNPVLRESMHEQLKTLVDTKRKLKTLQKSLQAKPEKAKQ